VPNYLLSQKLIIIQIFYCSLLRYYKVKTSLTSIGKVDTDM